MDLRRAATLHDLGITRYLPRNAGTGGAVQAEWKVLQSEVRDCRRCVLCETRTQTVFGVGDQQADLMIIGEAPGAEEDRQGEPFVGAAGQLLDLMLRAIGLDRGQVFIANILKCRPPGNRDPERAEAEACLGYLHRQIALVAPRVILCVGRVAAQNLLGIDSALGRLRGTTHSLPSGVPVIVTYHPAYLLRTPSQKANTWQDLKVVRRLVRDGYRA